MAMTDVWKGFLARPMSVFLPEYYDVSFMEFPAIVIFTTKAGRKGNQAGIILIAITGVGGGKLAISVEELKSFHKALKIHK